MERQPPCQALAEPVAHNFTRFLSAALPAIRRGYEGEFFAFHFSSAALRRT